MKKMKQLKKMLSLMLAAIMSLAMMIPVMAAGTEQNPTTGTITIHPSTDNTVTLKDKTLVAYKILNATMKTDAIPIKDEDGNITEYKDGFAYTIPEGLESFYEKKYGSLKADEANKDKTFDQIVTEAIAAMQEDSEDLENFAKEALAAAKAANLTAATGTYNAADGTVVFNNLTLGYYVIEDQGTATPISALILDTAQPDVDVNLKASQPVIDKKVDRNNGEDTADWQDSNNQAIGKIVKYQLTSKVPDMRGYKSYQFMMVDVLSKGLTFDEETFGNMAITIKGKTPETLTRGELNDKGNVINGDYAITVVENYVDEKDSTITGTKIEIIFKDFEQYRELTGNDIEVTYEATLNENAIIGEAGNENNVKLEYSNKPGESGDGDPDKPNKPIGETPWEKVNTYVTGIEIFKVDGDTKVPLEGAEFEITGISISKIITDKVVFEEIENADAYEGTKYWKLKDGSYTMTSPDKADPSLYADTSITYERTIKQDLHEVLENVVFKATTDAEGILAFDGLKAGEYKITEVKAPQGYNKIKDSITVKIDWVAPEDGKTNCTWKYTLDSNGTPSIIAGNRVELPIDNNTGVELPSTGGIGTTIFYIIGGILVVGAAILLVTKKRMSKEA